MKAVIDWMVDRDLVEGLKNIKLLRRAFDHMGYGEFVALDVEGQMERLVDAKMPGDDGIDTAILAEALCKAVVGKVLTSLLEAGTLSGGQVSTLRKQVADKEADDVLAMTAELGTPLAVLQEALRDGTLVTAPLNERVGGSGVGGVVIATGDRAVAYGGNHGGITTTGDNVTINQTR